MEQPVTPSGDNDLSAHRTLLARWLNALIQLPEVDVVWLTGSLAGGRATLNVELLRPLCQTARETGTGTYFCFLGHIAGGVVTLGRDPELRMDRQVLHDIRWFPLDEVQQHPEVARVWDALAMAQAPDRDGPEG